MASGLMTLKLIIRNTKTAMTSGGSVNFERKNDARPELFRDNTN